MLYPIVLLFTFHVVHQSFAILPPNYESLSAREKQDILWSQISSNPYSLDRLPTKFPQYDWVDPASILNTSYNRVIFERYADEMPVGRVKVTTAYGVAAKFRWVAFQNTSVGYTGIFNSNAAGVTRLTIPSWKVFAPNLAFKFLIDGQHSRNLVTYKGLSHRPSRNFFDGPFRDFHDYGPGHTWSPNAMAFLATTKVLAGGPNDRPEGPSSIPPYELGEVTSDGTSVGDRVVSPMHVQLRVSNELFNKIDPNSKADFRADIINAAPVGTLLFTMWGQAGPGTAFEPIGRIYTTSKFVASKYEDEVLFFRHPHKRWVPPYHHSRNHGYNFEVNMGFSV